ncbi:MULTISPECIES: MIP/aquaporin family protein [Sphingobacterium]|uniref:MIP/aquaporin family protein n=1 Tax=Sphingobacterium populi TaxID=1812824 RepID=A0ABW5UAV4_9SPHI|nr:MIP/aquaporin family protein [Sphingobacterium sp. CFCC 11742]
MTPFIAELFGTFLMLLLGGGVVANVVLEGTKGQNGGWIVITTGWALAVFVGVSVASAYSGAHLNPAVTLSVWMLGDITTTNALQYIAAQFIGATFGAFAVSILYRQHLLKTHDSSRTQAVFCTAPALRSTPSNLLSEALGTFVLITAILFFQEPSLQVNETAGVIGLGSIGAFPVAFLVWVIGLSLGGTTGYAINPARDLAPRMVYWIIPLPTKQPFDPSYTWIPLVGPMIGSAIATLLHQILISP